MKYNIYKITNHINSKIYVGKTLHTIEQRLAEHKSFASHGGDVALSRAIRKYGENNFTTELLDTANSVEESNQKEAFYIKKLNSSNRNIGYNLTKGGDGGDTYCMKTEKELNKIKEKISKANSGGHNGNSHKIKVKDLTTKNIYHFGSNTECIEFLREKNPNTDIFERIALGKIKEAESYGVQAVFLKKYIFASEDKEFSYYSFAEPKKGSYHYIIKNLETKEFYYGISSDDILSHFNLPKNFLGKYNGNIREGIEKQGFFIKVLGNPKDRSKKERK